MRNSNFSLPEWINAEAWAGFEEMRKVNGWRLTDRARWMAVRKLWSIWKDYGQHPNDVLGEATMRCWRGIWAIPDVSRQQDRRQEEVRKELYVGQGPVTNKVLREIEAIGKRKVM